MIMYRGKSGHPRIVQTYRFMDTHAEITYIKCLGGKKVSVRKIVPLADIYLRKEAK